MISVFDAYFWQLGSSLTSAHDHHSELHGTVLLMQQSGPKIRLAVSSGLVAHNIGSAVGLVASLNTQHTLYTK